MIKLTDLRYGAYHLGSLDKKPTGVFVSDYAAMKFGKVFWPKAGFVVVDLETGKEVIYKPLEITDFLKEVVFAEWKDKKL